MDGQIYLGYFVNYFYRNQLNYFMVFIMIFFFFRVCLRNIDLENDFFKILFFGVIIYF